MTETPYVTLFPEMLALFRRANATFLREEAESIATGVSERNLCGAFMLRLRRELDSSPFRKYHVDIEYNRNFGGRLKTIVAGAETPIAITCDLIVHSRGESTIQDNLIAVEMKRSSHPKSKKDKDKLRLKCLTKDRFDDVWSYDGRTLPEHVCRYVLGVFYEIDLAARIVRLKFYRRGKMEAEESCKF